MKNENMDEQTKELILSFVTESYELLEDVSLVLDKVEVYTDSSYHNPEEEKYIIDTIFRLFHTLKATASYLNFKNIQNLTHIAESYLDIFRKNEQEKVDPEDISALYLSVDCLTLQIKTVEKDFSDEGTEEETLKVVTEISRLMENHLSKYPPAGEITQSAVIESSGSGTEPDDALDNLVSFDMAEKFISDTLEGLDISERLLLMLEQDKKNVSYISEFFRKIHSIKGNAGFLGFADIEKHSMELESIIEDITEERIKVTNKTITKLLKKIDEIRNSVDKIDIKDIPAASPVETQEIHEDAAIDFHTDSSSSHLEESLSLHEENVLARKPIGEILIEMGTPKEYVEKALETQGKPLGEILVEQGVVSPDQVTDALKKQATETGKPSDMSAVYLAKKGIRVDTDKIDKLFDLVGELIIAEAMVVNNPEVGALKINSFTKSADMLTKITRELQEITMTIRMLPLEGLFNKMIRLVRDLSGKFKKKIDFQIVGQDTEMDKNVMEKLSDPLVHAIRNSIDHGIEDTTARVAAGKPETGKLVLSARYMGSEVWITIADDGKGFNRERIIKKAIERGILQGEPDKLSNQEVWQYIFEPGFSTAEKVSEVSGRGVGMDVVKKNIEQLNGKVEVDSIPGKGAEIIFKIPLTMAIIDGIILRVGENYYAVSIEEVLEFFVVKENMVVSVEEGREIINLRNDTMTVIKLHEAFQLKGKAPELIGGIVVIVQHQNRKLALLIDEVIGSQQLVIKSLPGLMKKIRGLRGCSILGDGKVSFILDIPKLV